MTTPTTAGAGDDARRWFDEVQFLAAVPMPEDDVRDLGTTVNGMWASPHVDAASVEAAHAEGRRILFSVPLIAITPRVWQAPETAALLDEVCADIDAHAAQLDWYYWETEPVYAACLFSDPFRDYLRALCATGVAAGADVVNLDEINTSVGLMSREPAKPGFCHRCLQRFRSAIGPADPASLLDDEALRELLRSDDDAYARYRTCLEDEAFATIAAFVEDVRGLAAPRDAPFAVTANLAYLGNHVGIHGRLWGASWGELLDFAMFENAYQLSPSQRSPHVLLPRGTFAPWYRLGAAVTGAPPWICPSILVPRQLDRERRNTYYLLMFLEAYAHGGRWGYFWWPGVDDATRREYTVPKSLRSYTDFIIRNRDHFEGPVASQRIAVLYLEGCVLERPEWHFEFLALAQALGEAGYQYDVVFSGDGALASDELPREDLGQYAALLIPDLLGATPLQQQVLAGYSARHPGALIEFGQQPAGGSQPHSLLQRLWIEHRDADRDLVLSRVPDIQGARVACSHPLIRVVRRQKLSDATNASTTLHLLNQDYRPETDTVAPSGPFWIDLDREAPPASVTIRTLDGEHELETTSSQGALRIFVENIDEYGLVVMS